MVSSGKPSPPSTSRTPAAAGQLLLDIFEERPSALVKPFEQWLTTSKPFAAFAQAYQRKIRKKAIMCRDVEETYNLYCEVRTAYLLLQEPKIAVAYEPYSKEQGRSADFAVTYRTNSTFHVEVTRLRTVQRSPLPQEDAGGGAVSAEQREAIRRYESRRLTDVACDKVGQLSPDTPNVLWVWSESRLSHELELGQVMLGLKRRIEARDADLYARYGFAKPADFIRNYQRLSALLILNPQQPTPVPTLLWQNHDAKHPLPTKITTLLRSLVEADTSPAFDGSA